MCASVARENPLERCKRALCTAVLGWTDLGWTPEKQGLRQGSGTCEVSGESSEGKLVREARKQVREEEPIRYVRAGLFLGLIHMNSPAVKSGLGTRGRPPISPHQSSATVEWYCWCHLQGIHLDQEPEFRTLQVKAAGEWVPQQVEGRSGAFIAFTTMLMSITIVKTAKRT